MSPKAIRVVFLSSILFFSCSKAEHKHNLEQVGGVKLPANVDVMKDEYVDTGKEYGIKYTVRLKPSDINRFTSDIRNSRQYRKAGLSPNGAWQHTQQGYSLYLAKKGIYYTIEVDTFNRIVIYMEQG
jgi:hypothetical protein